MKMATPTTAAKVTAATGAGGFAAALMEILLWGAGETWPNHPIPVVVQGALLVVVTAICTWAGGYLKAPSERDQIVPANN